MNRRFERTEGQFDETQRLRLVVILALGLLASAIARVLLAADADAKMPAVPPVSKFAPADDLVEQFDYYMKRIEEALAKKSDFDDAAKSRLKKDANTLTALALSLGMHDANNRFNASAGELLKASQSLATAANYEAAKAGLEELKKALSANIAGERQTEMGTSRFIGSN